jgi:hypothetical protein
MADDLGGMTTQFGLINSLRTGNMMLDMMVCMIVPLLFGGIGQLLRDMMPLIRRWTADIKSRNRVERNVQHMKRINQWGYSVGASTPDHFLQKASPLCHLNVQCNQLGSLPSHRLSAAQAIMLYVSKHVPSQHKKASFTLTSARERGVAAAAEYDSDDDGG